MKVLYAAIALIAACKSGSTASGGGTSPCTSAGTALCARAAVCAQDAGARLVLGVDQGEGGATSGEVDYASEGDCEQAFAAGCAAAEAEAGGEAGDDAAETGGAETDAAPIDYAACAQAAQSAACATTPSGGGVLVPTVCSE